MTREEMAYATAQAELCGKLAAIVRWCVENDGETLFDNPTVLTKAHEVLAERDALHERYTSLASVPLTPD